MAKINVRDYYPFYEHDEFVEVSDELAAEMAQWERTERSQKRKKYRYRANYSLDWGDGIGQCIVFRSVAPDESYEEVITHEQLRVALATLSPKQRQRIYAHYELGLSQAQIARCAGVRVSAVSKSIYSGLVRMEKCLKSFSNSGE